MKNNLGPSRRGKGAAVGLVICFVAVIALVGFFTFSRYKRDMSRQLAKAEEKTDTEEKQKDIKETEKSQTTNSQAIQNKAQETEKQKEEPGFSQILLKFIFCSLLFKQLQNRMRH